MRLLASLAVLLGLAQDPPAVHIIPGTLTPESWKVRCVLDRPDGTVIKVGAARVERRWMPQARRLEERIDSLRREIRTGEVSQKAFEVEFPPRPHGLYELKVTENAKELGQDRAFQGSPAALFAAAVKNVPKLISACEQLASLVNDLEAVARDEKLSTENNRSKFEKRVTDLKKNVLDAIGKEVDLAATIHLMNQVVTELLGAQVWPRSKEAAAQNDEKQIFSDEKITFASLKKGIEDIKHMLSLELRASAAVILAEVFRRAQEHPKRPLTGPRDAATAAIGSLAGAPEQDKAFIEMLGKAAHAEEVTLPGIMESLKGAAAELVSKP